jgi:acyl carrier protein phosphodiesterase
MNYLAHLVLSDQTPLGMVGNLAGDFLRGVDVSTLHPEIRRGVALHRAVDVFTDNHPVPRQSRERLDPAWRHWRRVLIDVFYDHCLARDFERHAGKPLSDFAAHVYAALEEQAEQLPPALQRAAPVMIEHDWLRAYAHIEGVEEILWRMSRRSSRAPALDRAGIELRARIAEFSADFNAFFPQLQALAAKQNSRADRPVAT